MMRPIEDFDLGGCVHDLRATGVEAVGAEVEVEGVVETVELDRKGKCELVQNLIAREEKRVR